MILDNETELAWAAGFFDGEGHISAKSNRQGPWLQLKLTIGQTDRQVLDRFQKAVGLGRVYGPYPTLKPEWNPIYEYSVQSKGDVEVVVQLLLPYLSPVKKEQCLGAFQKYADHYSMFEHKTWKSRESGILGR